AVDQIGRRVIRPPDGEILAHAAPPACLFSFFEPRPLGSPPPICAANGGEGLGVGGRPVTSNQKSVIRKPLSPSDYWLLITGHWHPPPLTPPHRSLCSRGEGNPTARATRDTHRHMHYNTSREVSMAKRMKSAKAEIDAFLKRLSERVAT